MHRTWNERNTQTEKWIRRRQKTSLNVRDIPSRNRPLNGNAWGQWIFEEPHRLDKYSYSCRCSLCRWEALYRSFTYGKCKLYQELEDYENRKW